MKQRQGGFTLIELVMVIVILGILAAVALPKFVDLSSQARISAVKGVAGGLSSASAINVAGCAVNGNTTVVGKCTVMSEATNKCSDIASLMTAASVAITLLMPDPTDSGKYYVLSDDPLTVAGTTCTLVLGDGTTAGVQATYVGYATGA